MPACCKAVACCEGLRRLGLTLRAGAGAGAGGEGGVAPVPLGFYSYASDFGGLCGTVHFPGGRMSCPPSYLLQILATMGFKLRTACSRQHLTNSTSHFRMALGDSTKRLIPGNHREFICALLELRHEPH